MRLDEVSTDDLIEKMAELEARLCEMEKAFKRIKNTVCGEAIPLWDGKLQVTETRTAIANLCDEALSSASTCKHKELWDIAREGVQQDQLKILQHEKAEVESRLCGMREALSKLGRHSKGCSINPGGPIMEALGDPDIRPCSCGLKDTLSSTPECKHKEWADKMMTYICYPCRHGQHYRCDRRTVHTRFCTCDTCDQIREDALQDRSRDKEE